MEFEEWMKDYHRGWPLWPEIPFYHMSDMKICWQASAAFTRKQVVEELELYCQHLALCSKSLLESYGTHETTECSCGLDAKLREGG
jgi:hypothetical protein